MYIAKFLNIWLRIISMPNNYNKIM